MATSTVSGSLAAVTSTTIGDSPLMTSSADGSPKKDAAAVGQADGAAPTAHPAEGGSPVSGKDTRRRVKIYALNDKRTWEDQGTGHVICSYSERLQGLTLTVRSESDNNVALESKILPETSYQKQQETLIVWSEGDNCDLALSFQEKAGCEEIWERICHVQGRDPSLDVTQDASYESECDSDSNNANSPDSQVTCSTSAAASSSNQHAGDAAPLQLPPCELSRLQEVNDLISQSFATARSRESLVQAIESQGYVKKLLDLFRMCEDLDNRDSLHLLHRIFMNIFMLNKNALFEILFCEENLKDVVGVFEYDPSSAGSYASASAAPPLGQQSREQPSGDDGPSGRSRQHRHYLWDTASFKEVIPMGNAELKAKIHQTYRVQYIQDFILPAPSIFEENLLSTLSSFIFFNKVEIVSLIQEDAAFLAELFERLTNETSPVGHRRDLSSFLKEFCSFSQKLQPQARDNFFRGLTSHGVLRALETCFTTRDDETRLNGIEILGHLVDYNASLVRDYALQQTRTLNAAPAANNAATRDARRSNLINTIIDQIFYDYKNDPEIAAALQVVSALKILIDPDNMMATVPKSDKSEFLAFFYKNCLGNLTELLQKSTTAPASAASRDELPTRPKRDDYHTAQILSVVLDLLTFCIEHHSFQMRTYAVNKNLLKPVLGLLASKHKFLALGALRLLRRVVNLKDEIYNAHIVRERLMDQVARCFKSNGPRYNLLNSALLEFFEFIRTEDIQVLVTDICENYAHYFQDVNYVKTFSSLKLRYEQSLERRKSVAGSSTTKFAASPAFFSGVGAVDDDADVGASFESAAAAAAAEERWFDDDEEMTAPATTPTSMATAAVVADDDWDDVVVGGSAEDDDDDVDLPSGVGLASTTTNVEAGQPSLSSLGCKLPHSNTVLATSPGKFSQKPDHLDASKFCKTFSPTQKSFDQSEDDFTPRPMLRPLTPAQHLAPDSPRPQLMRRQKIVIKNISGGSSNLNNFVANAAQTHNLNFESKPANQNADGAKSTNPDLTSRSVSPSAGLLRKSLVDYDDDSDEDEQTENGARDHTPKKMVPCDSSNQN